jgi:hypothetical protein
MALWSPLASGQPKTPAAATAPAGGRAIAERVLGLGESVWQYGGWSGRQKWQTVFACPLKAERAVGVLVLCDRERRPRDERLSARIELLGRRSASGSNTSQLKISCAGTKPSTASCREVCCAARTTNAGDSPGNCTIRRRSTLPALLMNLDRIGKADKPLDSRLRHLVTESRLLAEQCVGEIRVLANGLQPPLLDEMGLVSAVRWFVARFTERSGIRVEVEVHDVGRLAVAVERILFRVVQESLVNIERHAASPTAIVSLAVVNADLLLEVRDQGRGLRDGAAGVTDPPPKTGAGILAMRERVDQLGGEFDIHFTDHGTTVQVRVPLQERDR